MIASIKGEIQRKWEGSLLIEVQQIGYRVSVPQQIFDQVKERDSIQLFTHQYIREDSQELYGFRTMAALEFFEQLIGISGIGPKSALGVMSMAKIEDLQKAIIHGDPSVLTKVSGIGKKTAERVILELKNKIRILPDSDVAMNEALQQIEATDEAVQALVQLGYSRREAEESVKHVPESCSNAEEKIKEALRLMGTKVK